MKRVVSCVTTAWLAVLLGGCATFGGLGQPAVIHAKDKVAPALVHIRPVKEVYASGRRQEVQVVGSGFLISADGLVVTNEHVAGQSKFVRCVLYNKEEVDAEVVGTDPYTDLAVLRLDAGGKKLPFCKLGRSETLRVGETVLAMGSPHGLARSVSVGIVSVTDRYLPDQGDKMVSPFNTWIQTDAAINPGNSGGPLVNLKGEVIGVNARVLQGAENVGFAIPVDTAREVIARITAEGRVIRSSIGVTLQPMQAKTDDPTVEGVVIADVDPLSPGYEAGLRPGDVMTAVNGAPVNARFEEDLPAVRKLIADLPVGANADITVRRGDSDVQAAVATIEQTDMALSEVEFTEWAFTATEPDMRIIRQAQLPGKMGILVTGAQAGGPAANAGLKRGDIILKVDDTPIESMTQFQEVYRNLIDSGKDRVLMDVKYAALTRFVLLRGSGGEAPAPADAAATPDVEGDDSNER